MVKNIYYYKVYGLRIKSEIEIKEFMPISELREVDIEIKHGVMPQRIRDDINKGLYGGGEKNDIWFYGIDAAIYRILDGKTIYFEEVENSDPYLVTIYLSCSCMGFIMYQRDKLALHGGVVVINNKAIVVTGEKGAGKSTLTTSLRLKGYKFLSDDVAAIDLKDLPVINPGFPYQKLCGDAVDFIGAKREECFSFFSDTQVKYLVSAIDSFVNEDVQLYGMFEVVVGDVDEVQIEEIKGYEKLTRINENIYRKEFFGLLGGITPTYFKKCVDVAKASRYYKIIRPKNKMTVDKQMALIEEKVFNKKIEKV